MSETLYERMTKQQLIEQLLIRDQQLEQAQMQLARQTEELRALREAVKQSPGPAGHPDFSPASMGPQKVLPAPNCFPALRELGRRQYEQLTIAKVPVQLRSHLNQIQLDVQRQLSGDGYIGIKDWIFLSTVLRVGALTVASCPDLSEAGKSLVSTSDEAVEEALRTHLIDHVARLHGWEAKP